MIHSVQIVLFVLTLLFNATGWAAKDTRKNKWESSQAIWNFAIITACDKGLNAGPIDYFAKGLQFKEANYQRIESGDIVWVNASFVSQFYHQVLPKVSAPFVLVISDGDESFPPDSGLNPDEIESFISNANIIHIFAQNCDYQGDSGKVSHLPIGIDFHSIAYKGIRGYWGEKGSPMQQEAILEEILNSCEATNHRIMRAFVDFQLSDSMRDGSFKRNIQCGEDRTTIFNRLLQTDLIDYAGRMRRSDLWKRKSKYAFSISPHGNGLDCHRTWEDLALGCIVIVKTSPLDPLYEGLPVVIVQDWSEITKENMEKWLTLYGDAFTNPSYREKLTNAYWFSKIQAARQSE
jgi:hypothetical protein